MIGPATHISIWGSKPILSRHSYIVSHLQVYHHMILCVDKMQFYLASYSS